MKKSIVLCFLSIPILLFGQITVHGKLTQSARWSGTVIVKGDVIVPPGVMLMIDAGTKIIIDAKSDTTGSGKDSEHIEFIVLGQMIAEGTPDAGRIVFTSNSVEPRLHDWYGIIFKNRVTASTLKYCVIEYANKGISCLASAPLIENCEIRYNQYAGINCDVRSQPYIRNTTFYGNDFAGIVCELAAAPVIEKCTISQNENGVVISKKSQPDLGREFPAEGQSVGENFILNNFEYNIYNYSVNTIYAQNNLWNTINEAEIQATIFDRTNNVAKGEVLFTSLIDIKLFQPALLAQADEQNDLQDAPSPAPKRTRTKQPTASRDIVKLTPVKDKGEKAVAPQKTPAKEPEKKAPEIDQKVVVSQKTPAAEPRIQKAEPKSNDTEYIASLAGSAATIPTTSEQNNTIEPEPSLPITLDNSIESQEEASVEKVVEETKPAIIEPVIERLLDRGKRDYIRRVNAKYPDTYRKFKNDGKVLLEVFVGKDGRVENYRVLKSDGDLFTSSAIDALKQFRYKPGTYQGKPVRFKIVEPFVFKYYD